MNLTIERLRQLLHYEPATGVFTWLQRPNSRVQPGSQAGTARSDGYLQIGVDGGTYQAHRLAWMYVHGVWPDQTVDHANHQRADNRIANLRLADHFEQAQNISGPMARNKSGLLGASWHKSGMWRCRLVARGQVHQSYHRTAQEAHAAYMHLKSRLHPFSSLG